MAEVALFGWKTIEGILVHTTQAQADTHAQEDEGRTHTEGDEYKNVARVEALEYVVEDEIFSQMFIDIFE